MIEEQKEDTQWTPELERRYQYVQKKYEYSRDVGLTALKILLGTAISLAAVPIVFYERLTMIFPAQSMAWIYLSWAFILFSLLSGFLTYLLIFEGYYYQAHFEEERWLGEDKSIMSRYDNKSQTHLKHAHWSGITTFVSLTLALLCMIIPVVLKITSVLF